MRSAGKIAHDSEEEEDHQPEPKPGGMYPAQRGFIGRAFARDSDAAQDYKWQQRDKQSVETKSSRNMAVQQLMHGSQGPAAGA